MGFCEKPAYRNAGLDWIQMVAEGNYTEEDDGYYDAEALGKVLDRVIARLKEESQ